ncbi:hypothetical protein DYB38_001612 [Aphanomyces astaci]|uniref:Uncharacterized protein n=1 Tax=Aphanomyces astaci TaxID=112090 RepID=A0A397D662_APHAT|nr:hypothetical protein DYB38_001612 [Aphanomyces astaci]
MDEYLKLDQSKFPLHQFDSSEYDTKSPEEHLEECKTGASPFFVKGEWRWRPCQILSYNTDTEKYTIQFQGSDKDKTVRRINLRFDTVPTFQKRIDEAIRRREDAKAQMRFDYFVSQQSVMEPRSMGRTTLEGIHRRVVDGLTPDVVVEDTHAQLLRGLTDVVIREYTRAMKKAVLWYRLEFDKPLLEKYRSLNLTALPLPPPAPTFGKIPIPASLMTFSKLRKKISHKHFTASSGFLNVLMKIYHGWETAFIHLTFCATAFDVLQLPCRLLDFSEIQLAHCAKITEMLSVVRPPVITRCHPFLYVTRDNQGFHVQDWRRAISENLVDSLQDEYDFFISDRDEYDLGELKRLLMSIRVRMASQIRMVVEQSTEAWVKLVHAKVKANDPLTSLFDVHLVVTSEGNVEMSPSQQDIKAAMVTPLETMVHNVSDMDVIDPELLSLLNLDRVKLFDLTVKNDIVYGTFTYMYVSHSNIHCLETVSKLGAARRDILKCLSDSLGQVQPVTDAYAKHARLLGLDAATYMKQFKKDHPSPVPLDILCDAIRQFHSLVLEVETLSFDLTSFPLVCVNTVSIKATLRDKGVAIRNALIEYIVVDARDKNVEISHRYQAILKRITEKPTNEAELAALKDFVNASKITIAGIQNEVDEIHARLHALGEFSHTISDDDFRLAWSTKEWPLRVAHAADTCDSALEEDKIRMMDKLSLEKEQFELDLERYEKDVALFKSYGEIDRTEKYVELASTLYDSIMEAKAKADNFNQREAVFGFRPTEYAMIGKLETDFQPYYRLWTMCSEFNISKQAWLTGPFLELKGPEIDANVTEWWKASYKLSKQLADEAPGSAEVALILRERTDEFRAYLPVIQSLASPALRERHWELLRNKIGLEETDEELTLHQLLEKGITQHIETIQEVSMVAEKEYTLEKNLSAMISEWEPIEFECLPYRETGTYLIKSVDDIIALLDDHIVKTQTMRGSPYVKNIEKECKAWEKKLQYSQQLIDEWMTCQRTWLYLEAIFSSEDIMRQMPTEARRFASVDALWRKTMEDTVADPNFMNVMNMDKLLQKFQKANEKLDEIQKGLNDYLEMKRLYFPRFFFLSNDELLEILSQTKEPKAVQPHLGKCFEGINKVTFTNVLLITEMISSQGETVLLKNTVNPESAKNKGNVEMWLLELEVFQWDTLRDHTMRAIGTYPKEVREEWILKWPAQVVLGASQVYWTQEVNKAIVDKGNEGLKEYVEVLNTQLDKVVMLVRGNLTKLERTTIGALVVIDVHARDTIAHMIQKGVENDQDFEWISQLRYYWIEGARTKGEMDLQARIVNARVKYGYEYLGNTMRLVITPLTDRCYRTMMGAIDLLYGGAPEGPAGTGKTETVKDLSKAIAIQCVVFNCSDGLDYLAMAKFFKGLAGCGSWCCFDEFNRINIEVLSVIAQQILTINEGKKANVDKFMFEGTYIKLNASANVFITMNPAELPDNLKALFRPCAMMVPDYALISEIRLYSFGFANARANARKLTQVLQLSSEQLSSQKHYDYGMRAVNSILVAAGNLRQQLGDDPFWTEDKIVLRYDFGFVKRIKTQSVQDVNLPKFTTDDLPLFRGITSDLFPGADIPSPDHGRLIPMIDLMCTQGISIAPDSLTRLQPKVEFKQKVVQLYETVLVRHGLMVVGITGSGKTCIVHTLAAAITAVFNESEGKTQSLVHIHTMNPKSITSGQLYGNFDENTHEWSDGVLAKTYRDCARDTTDDRQWVMFDGPVDAVWIENMNTVLDDNKKLCLMSGEIVKMTDRMTMMFETEDLEEASPATVSRVGMIFLEPKNLGWETLMRTWLEYSLVTELRPNATYIQNLFEWLVPPLLFFVDKNCVVPTPVTFLELVASLIRLFQCILDVPISNLSSDINGVLEGMFFTAVIWSLGACVDTKSRQLFDAYFRELTSGAISADTNDAYGNFVLKNPGYHVIPRATNVPFPEEGLVYDYRFDGKKATWLTWMDSSAAAAIPRDMPYTSILVPTIDTERNAWLLDTLLTHHYHVMCTGDTGTGKSVSIKKKLLTGLNESFSSIFLNFSAQTSANQTQDIIESKLDKRRKGVLGPPLGMSCVIFVDDLNMPAKETYGAQPPIEILRQWMGHGGWYNRKDNSFLQLVDVQFMAAMGPPGGGRTKITQRYIRYFNLINFVPFDTTSLKLIFSKISDWFLMNFPAAIKALTAPLVAATIDIYDCISSTLLPTPAKSHYTFNLRDLSKVFQGISQGTPDVLKEPKDVVRLWSHECLRVFHDRLIDAADRKWFQEVLGETVQRHFTFNYIKEVRGPNDVLIYGNFGDAKANKKMYAELRDRETLQSSMSLYLDDFNNMTSAPMSLVLFQNAIEHVARISRVIHQPYGNSLLVGVGGSGRKSLTTLAVSMADFKLFQIEISKTYSRSDWRADLKKVLTLSGVTNQPTVFLFSDTQIVEEGYLEDINGILNTGEVANLWANDELMTINESLESAASASGLNTGNAAEVYNFFVSRCRTNLHVVLALSPIGDAFRRRLRMFPSLVNCCTIDWFTEWPEEALRSVADHFLVDIEMPSAMKTGLVDVCVDMQERVSQMSKEFLQSLRRHYYVTPTSYLELINTFKKLLNTKRTEVSQMKKRYDNGLTKLMETADQVEKMQVELEALQPMLKVATVETDALLETISREQKDANETKTVVAAEEAQCNEQAAAAMEIKTSCEAGLAEAIPALEMAVKALQTLTKGDITEVKAMKKPPDGVKLVMEAVCIMMGVAPVKVKDPAGGNKKVDDYWGPAQKTLLNDTRFLQNLLEYDKDNIQEETAHKVTPYTNNPDFSPPIIKKASVAASGLCSWVHAMVVYNRVSKTVAPKREALKAATAQLEAAQANLKAKQDALQIVLDKVARLEADLAGAMKKKADLQFQVDDCSKKLVRANQLIGGLGGERSRWQEMSAKLQVVYDNVVGDIMLSSGVIAYLGAFTSTFREKAVNHWSLELKHKGITCSDKYSLTTTLGDLVKIREWTIAKLPNDSFSIDNAIMMQRSNRWPLVLMIDPQGQANRWVKNMEEKNGAKVVKLSQAGFVRALENAIMVGAPFLIENVPEEIDPMLEPVLLKQIVKAGGVLTIRLGDNTVEYDVNFRLYMTTKLRNPHYPPETCVKVNLLNFMATEEGLQDQMLGIVVAKEEPVLEAQREKLVLEDAANKKTLKEIEDTILHMLQTAEGNILNDERLIETLGASKITANKIEEKVQEPAATQLIIAEKRAGYTPVAFRASQLFFCIADLSVIDPMYQYALEWFIQLFVQSIGRATKSSDLTKRLTFLNEQFTYTLYVNVCRSLFEKDKLLFAFLLTVKILTGNGTIQASDLRYFFTGNTTMDTAKPNPNPAILSVKTWADIVGLDGLPTFQKFSDNFVRDLQLWTAAYTSQDPMAELETIPSVTGYDLFQKLIVLRCFRPDKVVPSVMTFVASMIGQRFIEPQPFDLKAGYDDSTCATPLIFVLTPGADPMSELLKLAAELGFTKKFVAISLGQGQGPLAENAIAEAIDNGNWVCLQNCHLSVSWLPTLERLCEEITPDRVHASFRLWLTSEPSRQFPPFILQNGVKMTNEPPKGMRANLKGSFLTFTDEWLDSSSRPQAFKKLLFGLCFFHATVRERTKFGPLGWNIKYVFSGSDLNISKDQLKICIDDLNETDAIPYAALAYLAGECNYGGRVTDDKDRRCIVNTLSDFYTPSIQDEGYKFSPSGTYYCPAPGPLSSYLTYIDSLPMNEGPEVFGLHDNANISCAIAETNLLLESALSLQPRSSGGGGKSWDQSLAEAAADISHRIPPIFDTEKADLDFPVCYDESMNTVLTQELIRFNRLIAIISRSLKEVQRALKGLVVLSAELEAMGNSMVNGQVPLMWSSCAYPSLKPLGSWVTDFLDRLTFLQTWIDAKQSPATYWISGFFFTQAFITGTLQNFARKHTQPIDQVTLLSAEASSAITSRAPDGAYIFGLFMEGARWENAKMSIVESRNRELHVAMPMILLLPKRRDNIEPVKDSDPKGTAHMYMCPVYKTSFRQGTLSTTGHSTNFVMFIRVPMSPDHNQKHWIRRGVAMLTQLDI